MNASEAAVLLAFCATYDQRRVGEMDARAWGEALDRNVTPSDARAAVLAFYSEVAERRIMPADVNHWSRQRRAERLAAYTGTPAQPSELDDEPVKGQQWLRAFWRGIGDGLTAQEADAAASEELGVTRYGIERPRPVEQVVQQTADRLPRIPRREDRSA